jgi:hypothetical protein
MKSILRASIAAILAMLAVSASAAAASEQPSSAATSACGSIAEGSSGNNVAACAQGFTKASSHEALAASCALGVGEVSAFENEHDCKIGFFFAGGGSEKPPATNAKATTECEAVTLGASDGSPAACEQGYEDALAGETQDASCDHLGSGAVSAPEYTVACEDGWFVAKDEPDCIPGIDPENGQQGTTIEADSQVDKACTEAA